jgi:uncharacterized small protein (DUF1192 family)
VKSMFGAVDRKDKKEDGKVCSYSPAWAQTTNVNELEMEIIKLEQDVNAGLVPSEEVYTWKREIESKKKRREEIVGSKPKYSVSEEKALLDELKVLNEREAKTLYSEYEQEQPGKYSNPRREADLNDFPCIEVNKAIAKICDVKDEKMKGIGSSQNVKISRNQVDKVRRIICDYFGIHEHSREYLRKKNMMGAKTSVGYVNNNYGENYDAIFGAKEISPDIKEVEELRAEIARLKAEKSQKTPEKRERKAAETAPWECAEEGCGFKGTNKNKGIHMALHARQAKKQKELITA